MTRASQALRSSVLPLQGEIGVRCHAGSPASSRSVEACSSCSMRKTAGPRSQQVDRVELIEHYHGETFAHHLGQLSGYAGEPRGHRAGPGHTVRTGRDNRGLLEALPAVHLRFFQQRNQLGGKPGDLVVGQVQPNALTATCACRISDSTAATSFIFLARV